MKWTIRDRETGTVIDEFDSFDMALDKLEEFEEEDRNEGNYTPDFYEIREAEE